MATVDELSGTRVLVLDDGHCFRDQALQLCSRTGAREGIGDGGSADRPRRDDSRRDRGRARSARRYGTTSVISFDTGPGTAPFIATTRT